MNDNTHSTSPPPATLLPGWLHKNRTVRWFLWAAFALLALGDALHCIFTATRAPFQGPFDDFLHQLAGPFFFAAPWVCLWTWRKVLFLCGGRLHLKESVRNTWGVVIVLLFLLVAWASGQLDNHEFAYTFASPIPPQFLGGPFLAVLCGMIYLTEPKRKSLTLWMLLAASTAWFLFPVVADFMNMVGGNGVSGFTTWQLPILATAGESISLSFSLFLYVLNPLEHVERPESMALAISRIALLLLLIAAPLIELRLKRISYATAFTTIAATVAMIPYYAEWSDNYWD